MGKISVDWVPESEVVTQHNVTDSVLSAASCQSGVLSGRSTFINPDGGSAANCAAFPAIPGFLIHEKVGQGGMGVVYKATQTSLNRMVALKLLPKALAAKQHFIQRFYEETKALSTLTHPNIVTIIDRGNVGDTYYFVMEYVVGTPLSEKIGEPMPARRLLGIAQSVCQALKYAHAKQLVHRDIKPANIMLTSNGVTKLMDFGLAGVVSNTHKAAAQRTTMGTPGYMSPEQMRNAESADGRSDIFSLGVVLYEMATGVRPCTEDLQPPSELCERADPRLDPIIAKCLALEAEDRYESAEELLADIGALRRDLEEEPPCPVCGHVSPLRSIACEECGRNLADFFDLCPDCSAQNRCDVRKCLKCGADLEARRAEVQGEIEQKFQQAHQLTYAEKFYEARLTLKEVVAIKGRSFEGGRMRAVAMLKKLDLGPRQIIKQRFTQGKLLFDQGHVEAAIAIWEGIKPQTEQIKTIIKSARLNMTRAAELAKARKMLIVVAAALGITLVLAAAVGAIMIVP